MAHKFETLIEVFQQSTQKFASRELFGEKKNGVWTWVTYGRFAQLVDDLRGGLAQLGVRAGDAVAVISNNRSEWAIGAYASYTLGASYVAMYEAQQPKEWQYILNDCGAKVCFVANDKIGATINGFKAECPKVQYVIRFDGGENEPDTFASLLRRGAETPAPIIHPKPQDLASLIYTSGTTGNPKGVMLSHGNLAGNVSAMHECFPMRPDDRSLSFLPWAHSFGQTVELHGLYSMGASMGIAESTEKIVDNMAEIRPTLLFAVPRIFNRIYDGLQKRMASESPIKRALFERGMAVAKARKKLEAEGRHSALLDLQHAFFDRVVFSKVRARFGGRLQYAFSGGAAMTREVAEFIDNLGIMVYEGYGLTETSPIATANYPGNRKIGSVGKPIPGTRVEIDTSVTGDPKQGEIIVHGHNVMLGYFNLPEENAKVFTGDGGFRTGDMGYMDEDGYVWITGRIKEQYKLENGKYVVPGPIEQQLVLSPFITNAMVHGMNKPFNVAIIVVDQEALKKWATERGFDTSSMPELLKRPEVQKLYQEQVAEYAKDVKGYERPQRLLLITEDFTTQNDMLTPSLKVKRRNVLARYNDAVEELYKQALAEGVKAA
ncbi:MAG: long-chain fatty acid--CoA ligase [Myxococcaceae bacterium]|nr:long-chain fatty acid--CoA ligase [Myxococcaceae bacterium]